MTQVLQILGIAMTVIGVVGFAAASFGQMRAARDREFGADFRES